MKNDLIIIGAGPVGLYSAFYAGMRGLNTLVIDSLKTVGGQLTSIYPEKFVYDVPGISKITAADYITNLKEQADQFTELVSYALGENVINVEKLGDHDFKVTTDQKEYFTKAVLIACGNGAFIPRTMGLENEKEFKNISYFVPSLEKFRNKKVALFGGGDSAVDWALMLNDYTTDITVIHRRNEFRAHESSVDQLRANNTTILTPYIPKALHGENGIISKITLENKETKEEKIIEVDEVIVNFGFQANLGPIEAWGLTIENRGIKVDAGLKTNIEGIYAVGNIAYREDKLKLIICGMGETPIAINNIKHYIDPNAKGSLHSSALMEKK